MEIAVSSSPAHIMMTRRKNTWYTIRDGNWSDPHIWMSNALAKKNITYPQPGDDVYINHNVDYNNSVNPNYLFNNSINNLFISGKLTAVNGGNQNNLIIKGNLQCTGIIDFTTAGAIIKLSLMGTNNFVNNFYAGTQSYIIYNGVSDQPIMPLIYCFLQIDNGGKTYLTGDLNITNTFQLSVGSGTLEIGPFNYNSVPISNIYGTLSKNSSSGFVNFAILNVDTVGSSTGSITFTGNPIVNMSGNFTGDLRAGVNFGTNTINILTNQTWTINGNGNIAVPTGSGSVLIASGKTLTITGNSLGNGSASGGWINNGIINGVDDSSVLNINAVYGYGNSNTAMSTGVFNYNHSGIACIQVQSGVNLTLPMTSFYDMVILGNATLSGDTIVTRNLVLSLGSSSLQMSTYNFTCNGTVSYSGSLLKSGSGIVNFNNLSPQNGLGSVSFTGNPTVNLSGNFIGDVRAGANFGTNPINIIANLSLGLSIGGNVYPNTNIGLLIGSGITLINIGISSTFGGLGTTGIINGVDSTSVFDNRSIVNYQNAQQPMQSGKLYCNQAANTFIYGLAGNQDVTPPSDSTPGYQNLTLNNSGAKRLLGNVSVKGVYTLTSPATLNSNGFSLTNP